MFSEFQQTSHKCKSKLMKEIKKLGAIPKEGIKTIDFCYRFWINLKGLFIRKDCKNVITACECKKVRALTAISVENKPFR
jgi:hypothetical protein